MEGRGDSEVEQGDDDGRDQTFYRGGDEDGEEDTQTRTHAHNDEWAWWMDGQSLVMSSVHVTRKLNRKNFAFSPHMNILPLQNCQN